MIAPSGTTPVVTNLHSPTSSLRARATIITRLLRPPAALVRSWNHNVKADFGWCLSHSQLSWIIGVRTRAFPAFETPVNGGVKTGHVAA